MKLKYQLLLLALISVLFPITGWLALKSVDKEFRLGIEQAAHSTLASLHASVSQIIDNDSSIELNGLVAGKLQSLSLDGDINEWSTVESYNYHNQELSLSIKIAQYNNKLALLIKSNDTSKNNFYTKSQDSDAIVIALANNTTLYKFTFNREAEGQIIAQNNSQDLPKHSAFWHETADGYLLEVQFAENNFHHLGFASVNAHDGIKLTAGTLQEDGQSTLRLLPLVSNNKKLQNIIASITPQNNQFSIKDKSNRLIAQSNKLPNNQQVSSWQWLITPLYQWMFAIENNEKWFYRVNDGMAGVKIILNRGELSYELKSMMPQGQQNMIQTLLKAGVIMLLVVFIIMVVYLLYALILAWRIRNLNHALQKVLDRSGQLHTLMPSNKSMDEIGQLSRGIQSMLGEMQQYTHYLKDLGSRLSHEMKTPLAIVQSSLDNLAIDSSLYSNEFLQRAILGTTRLKFILNQLSELNSLKLSLENTPKNYFNLTSLCKQLGSSYGEILINMKLSISDKNIMINGSSELMAQLLDKLIENAKDFTPRNEWIELKLSCDDIYAYLSVTNSGSQLPIGLNIFESMVSKRKSSTNEKNTKTHLGLGLYIVQLIAHFHQAELTASDSKGPEKVIFKLKIPLN